MGKDVIVERLMVDFGYCRVDVGFVTVAVLATLVLSSKIVVLEAVTIDELTGTVVLENVVSELETVMFDLVVIVTICETVDNFLVVISIGVVPTVLKIMVARPDETVFCCTEVNLVGGCTVWTGFVLVIVVGLNNSPVAFWVIVVSVAAVGLVCSVMVKEPVPAVKVENTGFVPGTAGAV